MAIGYVQAGGASARFGRDKALAMFGGKTMLQRTCELLREACEETAVIAPMGRYELAGIRQIADRWPAEGPLGGIVTALMDAKSCDVNYEWALIVSCDMPFLTGEWLRYLVKRASKSGAEAVFPRSATGLEPLCACWRVSAARQLESAFAKGVRKIGETLRYLETETLDEAEWKRFDSAGRLFSNMNTLAEYEEMRRELESREG